MYGYSHKRMPFIKYLFFEFFASVSWPETESADNHTHNTADSVDLLSVI